MSNLIILNSLMELIMRVPLISANLVIPAVLVLLTTTVIQETWKGADLRVPKVIQGPRFWVVIVIILTSASFWWKLDTFIPVASVIAVCQLAGAVVIGLVIWLTAPIWKAIGRLCRRLKNGARRDAS
ncbi:MAG TPA: hypothetical protein VKR06_40520 [Ktedonosporobacter sp.]|nr:hypothetical protein [Ktedonosporobacter sp.]